jgi:hypothetical protein
LSYVIGRIQIDSAGVQGAEENIWTKKGETQEAGENEHHDVSFLPSVVRMIKSRRMRGWGMSHA